MSAMNGSTPARSRGRLLLAAVAAVFALAAVLASSAGAATFKVPPTSTDLALGDSLAFGYSQQLFNEHEKEFDPPAYFEHGYANYYYNHLKPNENHIQLTNLGCPGETSKSLIGNGPLGAALEFYAHATTEAPCAYHAAGLPLHHEYGGTKSQLESALEQVAVDAAIGAPVQVVTLNIGANDQLHQIAACKAQATTEVGEKIAKGELAYEEPLDKQTGEHLALQCVIQHVEGLIKSVATNIAATVFALRHGSTFGGVDYAGKIIFQAGYDPYGNVYGTGELLPGSVGLAGLFNGAETKLLTDSGTEAAEEGHEPFNVCVANPEPYFNPGGKREPYLLSLFTNMANFTTFEGKANGPDIHPTPTGYNHLAKIMVAACG